MVDQRPWYFRFGYQLGVWGGALFIVLWYVFFEDLIGLPIGIVLGQVVGIFLSRQGRSN